MSGLRGAAHRLAEPGGSPLIECGTLVEDRAPEAIEGRAVALGTAPLRQCGDSDGRTVFLSQILGRLDGVQADIAEARLQANRGRCPDVASGSLEIAFI